jgi:hypothetical protein
VGSLWVFVTEKEGTVSMCVPEYGTVVSKHFTSYEIFSNVQSCMVGRDRSVGIATRYGLDDPGIESRWGREFLKPSRPALGPHPASYTMDTGSFPGVKWPGRGVDHPPPYSAEVKERIELYLYSPSGPSWPVLG